MIEDIFLIIMFVGLFAALLTGHPMAFAMGGIAVLLSVIGWGPESISIFVNMVYTSMNNYTLIAIPLFVLMGNFLSYSGIANGLFESLRFSLGRLPGGLAIAVVIVSTIFAATTGVVGASVVTIGMLSIPVLLKYGYDQKLTTGVVAAGGTLGILIPPSIMLVVMGSYAQVSVGDLFKTAIVPGLLLSLCYAIYVLFICWKNPSLGPAISKEELATVSTSEIIKNFIVSSVPMTLLIVAVLVTIYTGIATPTEASGVGAAVALLLTIFYKQFNLKMLKEAVYDTAKTTAMVLFIVIGADAFTSMFLGLNGDQTIHHIIESLGLSGTAIFIALIVAAFILGIFMEWPGIVSILFPIFIPLLKLYDFNLVWVITCVAVALQTSFLTPPVGGSLFYLKGIVPKEIKMGTIFKGVTPFVFIMLFVLVLIMVFPELIMWLIDEK
ncbi:TRAP transporter large permease subunit [Ureibacillus composti]|nr:TRAP transporter large permease subunit [Ureibacillus composti]